MQNMAGELLVLSTFTTLEVQVGVPHIQCFSCRAYYPWDTLNWAEPMSFGKHVMLSPHHTNTAGTWLFVAGAFRHELSCAMLWLTSFLTIATLGVRGSSRLLGWHHR